MELDLHFVKLKDGRSVAFRELGCSKETSTKSLLVLHGTGSSRIAAIPGVREDLLQEFGVRLVAIDRPGYGKSDPDPNQTLKSSAFEIEVIIDKLELGSKVWLLGYSGGGAYCWAAARYIPHRLHGIALCAPIGNYWWQGISYEQRTSMLSTLTPQNRRIPYMKILPGPLVRLYARFVIAGQAGQGYVEHAKKILSPPDQKHLQEHETTGLLFKDSLESMTFNKGFGLAKDLKLFTSDWGFEVEEVASSFQGPIHIWQGTEDWLVPLALQQWIQSRIPHIVHLHALQGEGHLSWFCFNDQAHRKVFETLFSPYRFRTCRCIDARILVENEH